MIFVNAVCPGSLLVARNFSLTGFRACRNNICECGILSVMQSEGLDTFSASMSLSHVYISFKYFLMLCSKEPKYHFLLCYLLWIFFMESQIHFFHFLPLHFSVSDSEEHPHFFLLFLCGTDRGKRLPSIKSLPRFWRIFWVGFERCKLSICLIRACNLFWRRGRSVL